MLQVLVRMEPREIRVTKVTMEILASMATLDKRVNLGVIGQKGKDYSFAFTV